MHLMHQDAQEFIRYQVRHQATKGSVKCAISRAQETERKKFGEKLDGKDKRGNLFRLARRMV